jgi:hypothetical protein
VHNRSRRCYSIPIFLVTLSLGDKWISMSQATGILVGTWNLVFGKRSVRESSLSELVEVASSRPISHETAKTNTRDLSFESGFQNGPTTELGAEWRLDRRLTVALAEVTVCIRRMSFTTKSTTTASAYFRFLPFYSSDCHSFTFTPVIHSISELRPTFVHTFPHSNISR